MIVREGVFLKEEDVDKLASLLSRYYLVIQELERLKHTIQSVQDYKLAQKYGQSFVNIAEAYQSCAVVEQQLGIDDVRYWDLAGAY